MQAAFATRAASRGLAIATKSLCSVPGRSGRSRGWTALAFPQVASGPSAAATAPFAPQHQHQRRRWGSGSGVCRAAPAGGAGGAVRLEIKVEGMMCGGCSSRVEEALKGLKGVRSVAVDLEAKTAALEVDAADAKPATFVQAIKDLGFEAEPVST